MELQTTNGKLYELLDALNTLGTRKLPTKLAHLVSKALKEVRAEVTDIENTRLAILDKYRATNEEGQKLFVGNTQIPEFIPNGRQGYQQEVDELNQMEVTLQVTQIPEQDLLKLDEIEPFVFAVLDPILVRPVVKVVQPIPAPKEQDGVLHLPGQKAGATPG